MAAGRPTLPDAFFLKVCAHGGAPPAGFGAEPHACFSRNELFRSTNKKFQTRQTGPFTNGGATLGAGLATGSNSNALTVGLNTKTAGIFAGSAGLALASHDADLADISVAAGPADLLDGSYSLSGSGFPVSGNTPFSNLAAGFSQGGHNASGYSAGVADVFLTLQGSVGAGSTGVPEPASWLMMLAGLLGLVAVRKHGALPQTPPRV